MNEDEMRRVREQQEQLEVWARERRQELRQEVLSQAERDEAISVACKTALVGALPSVAWYYVSLIERGFEGAFVLVMSGVSTGRMVGGTGTGAACFFVTAGDEGEPVGSFHVPTLASGS